MNEISRLFWMTMTSHASDILNMNGIPDIPCSIHTGGLMGGNSDRSSNCKDRVTIILPVNRY